VERILEGMDESGYLSVGPRREVSKPVYRPLPVRPPVRERHIDAGRAAQDLRRGLEALEQPVDIPPTTPVDRAQKLRKEIDALEESEVVVHEPVHEPEAVARVKSMYVGLGLEELTEKRNRAIEMRNVLKKQYSSGKISQGAYEEALKANVRKIVMIDKEIRSLQKEVSGMVQLAPSNPPEE
jgi:hypothetical protein